MCCFGNNQGNIFSSASSEGFICIYRETESSEDKKFQDQTTEDLSTSENSLNQTTFVTAKETKAEGIEVL
jgi:hypothetical protein